MSVGQSALQLTSCSEYIEQRNDDCVLPRAFCDKALGVVQRITLNANEYNIGGLVIILGGAGVCFNGYLALYARFQLQAVFLYRREVRPSCDQSDIIALVCQKSAQRAANAACSYYKILHLLSSFIVENSSPKFSRILLTTISASCS